MAETTASYLQVVLSSTLSSWEGGGRSRRGGRGGREGGREGGGGGEGGRRRRGGRGEEGGERRREGGGGGEGGERREGRGGRGEEEGGRRRRGGRGEEGGEGGRGEEEEKMVGACKHMENLPTYNSDLGCCNVADVFDPHCPWLSPPEVTQSAPRHLHLKVWPVCSVDVPLRRGLRVSGVCVHTCTLLYKYKASFIAMVFSQKLTMMPSE